MSLPAWGNPWRGLVQAGNISLPGGLTKATPQPEGNYSRHYDEPGQTFLQRGPLAGVSRTPAELAADAAAGRTWRDDAILSGARMHLYGEQLDGWIYCAPDGTRWLVETAGLLGELNTSEPWNLELFLQRFGEFQGEYESQTVSASLLDLGQAEPDPEHPIGTQGYAQVCDIRPDGSRALIMLFQPVVPFAYTGGWHPLHKRPLGWLELQLSQGEDGISVSLSVVRTRTQSMGGGSFSYFPQSGRSLWLQDYSVVRVDKGDYWEYTYTPQPLGTTVTGTSYSWSLSSGNYSYSFSGRILALWYTPSGGFEEVTLQAETSGTVNNPEPAEVCGGTLIFNQPKSGGSSTTISDTRVHTISRTCTCSEQFSLVLRRGGVIVDQSSGTASSSLYTELRMIWQTLPEYFSRSDQVTVDGVTDTDASSGEIDRLNYTLGVAAPNWFTSIITGNSPVNWAWVATDMSLFTPGRMIVIDPVRYSNNLIGLRRWRQVYDSGTESWLHGPAAHPGGTYGADAVVSRGAVFGSYNPATGEVAINQSQATCWI